MNTEYFKADIAADLSEQARGKRVSSTLCERYLENLWYVVESAAKSGKNNATYIIWSIPEEFDDIKEYLELKLKAGGFGYQFSKKNKKQLEVWW